MDKLTKAKRLKDMLSQIAGAPRLKSITSSSTRLYRWLEGVEERWANNIQSGLEKLADGRLQDMTPNEMFLLEATMMKENRPVVFVRGNS